MDFVVVDNSGFALAIGSNTSKRIVATSFMLEILSSMKSADIYVVSTTT